MVIAEQPLAKGFGGFAGFEVLVEVFVNRLSKHSRRDLVNDFICYGFLHHAMDSSLSTKGG